MKRKITISVMAPVTVELLVKPQDPEDLDGSWDIDCVLRADLHHTISPRSIYESIDDETLEEINNLATQARDRDDRGQLIPLAITGALYTSERVLKPMDAPGPDLKRDIRRAKKHRKGSR